MSKELSEIHIKLEIFIKKYYLNQVIRGFLLFSILSLVFFLLLAFGEFLGHFSILVRTILFFTSLTILVLFLILWVLKPFLSYFKINSSINNYQANEILQQHFSELKDQLKNILELEKMHSSAYSTELIGQAIQQKSSNIRLIPFNQAIEIKANLKYVKIIGLPILTIILLLFYSPKLLLEGTERIFNYNQFYETPSVFIFIIENDSLSVKRGEDLNIKIHTEGEYIPYPIFIEYGGVEYLLQKQDDNLFSYELKNVNQSFKFYLKAEDYQSRAFNVKVLPTPKIIDFQIKVTPPRYTEITEQVLNNNGDFMAPEGSKIEWNFKTKDIDNLWMTINDSLIHTEYPESNFFVKKIYLEQNIDYSINVSNKIFKEINILKYTAQVIPDEYPSINIQSVLDSLHPTVYYFRGQVNDDYGIRKINFCYQHKKSEPIVIVEIPLSNKEALQEFYYAFDFKEVVKQGDNLFYYFEVWDNDGVNGSKKSKSQEFQFYLSSKKELEEIENENSKSMQDKLTQTQELAKELQKDVKSLKKDLIEKDANSWQVNKKLTQIKEKQNTLEQLMKEVAQENKKTNELLKNLSNEDQQLLEKQKEIEDLLNQLMDEEMKKLMEEINKLMEEFNKDDFNKLTDEMDMSYKDLSEQLDRNLEQLKRYNIEKKLQKSINELKELAKKHEELSKETKAEEKSSEELKQQQAEHQKKMKDIASKIEDSMKKNKELKEPLKIQDISPQADDIKSGMQKGSESLQKGQNGKASKQQQKSAQQMSQMATQMQQMMNSATQQQQGQDMESLRQILENLNTFSFEQENIMLNFRGLRYKDPRYIQLFNDQTKERENFDLIKDSLYALALTQPMLASPINKELLNIERELNKTEKALDDRQARKAQGSQQMVMTSANNLSLLLSEILKQMQQQAKSSCKKAGSCNNPKGGKPKPGFGQAKKQGQSIKQQMQEMLNQLKKGKGKGGKKSNNGKLGKMIAEQEKMQKLLSDLENSQGLSPQTAKKLKEIKNISKQVEDDLIQQNITPTTLKRQELILTRLLEAENAELKRGKEDKRESNIAKSPKISNPKDFFKYKQENLIGNDVLLKSKFKLQPFYKKKYKNYLININE